MKKTITFAILAFSACSLSPILNTTTAQQNNSRTTSHSTPFQSDADALKSYFQSPELDLDEVVPNHLTGVHVAAASHPVVTQPANKIQVAKTVADSKQVASGSAIENQTSKESTKVKANVSQVQYIQGQDTGQVQQIQGEVIFKAPPLATNVAKPTPQNSEILASEPYIVDAPIVAPIESPGYAQPYRQNPAAQATTLDPYASRAQSAPPSWTPKANTMRHVSDRFSEGGEPFAYSTGRANPEFFGVNRNCLCDEWSGFCDCGGLKYNRGHLGIPSLRSKDNCEQGRRKITLKVKKPCVSQSQTCGCPQCSK